MDVIKTVFEIMLSAGVKPAIIDKLLASQQEQYPQDLMPRAVYVMSALREFVNDSARTKHREQVQQILTDPSAGSA